MILETINTFRAVRDFKDEPVPDDTIRQILNAGRRAQSSKNTQAWQFIAIRDRQTLEQLAQAGRFATHVARAAFAAVLTSPVDYPFDIGQATAYMQLAAWELGVGSCIASLHEPDKARTLLGVPDTYHCDTAISFGYPANQSRGPLKAGGRLPLDQVVHWEHW